MSVEEAEEKPRLVTSESDDISEVKHTVVNKSDVKKRVMTEAQKEAFRKCQEAKKKKDQLAKASVTIQNFDENEVKSYLEKCIQQWKETDLQVLLEEAIEKTKKNKAKEEYIAKRKKPASEPESEVEEEEPPPRPVKRKVKQVIYEDELPVQRQTTRPANYVPYKPQYTYDSNFNWKY